MVNDDDDDDQMNGKTWKVSEAQHFYVVFFTSCVAVATHSHKSGCKNYGKTSV